MKFFRDAIVAILAMCGMFALLEGGLRLSHARLEASFYDADNERGYVLRPNTEGWSTAETDVYLKINSAGQRDVERPLARPPHTLRVAVVGSSEAEAGQVPLDETFEAVMTRELSRNLEKCGWKAEVLNFGTDGYTPSQVYLTLKNHVWQYDPQLVIFLFSAWTVQKTVRDFYPNEIMNSPVWILEDGKLVPDHITRNLPHLDEEQIRQRGRRVDLMNRSALLTLLHAAAMKAQRLPDDWQAELAKALPASSKTDGKGTTNPAAVDPDFIRSYNPYRADMREAWEITEAFFKIMKENCDEHRAEFWVVAADQAMQVDRSLAARKDFARRMGLETLDASDERLKRFGSANGIPVFAPAHILGDYAVSHNMHVHGSVSPTLRSHHWNKVGQELAGNAIAQELLTESAKVRHLTESGPAGK